MRMPLWPFPEGRHPDTRLATEVADAWALLLSRTGKDRVIEQFLRDSRALHGGRDSLACRQLIHSLTYAPYRWHIAFVVDYEAWRCRIRPTPHPLDRWEVGAMGSTMEDAFCRTFVLAVKAECHLSAFDALPTRSYPTCRSR